MTRKLDRLWSEIIKKRAGGRCERCGAMGPLNAHHIHGRRIFNTRWSLNNGIALCHKCHVFGNDSAHQAPLVFAEWLRKEKGQEWYDDLLRRYHTVQKVDKEAIYEELKKEKEILDGGKEV